MTKANDTQIGGTHYKDAAIKCPECGHQLEHWDLAWLFKWDNFQYAITKYVMRWRTKHGLEDLKKAQHCIEKYLEVVQGKKEDKPPGKGSNDLYSPDNPTRTRPGLEEDAVIEHLPIGEIIKSNFDASTVTLKLTEEGLRTVQQIQEAGERLQVRRFPGGEYSNSKTTVDQKQKCECMGSYCALKRRILNKEFYCKKFNVHRPLIRFTCHADLCPGHHILPDQTCLTDPAGPASSIRP